ncbi:MAG: hypothetical protein WCA97_15090 [Terriglobales bacterium]|jgi:hypothetical protein
MKAIAVVAIILMLVACHQQTGENTETVSIFVDDSSDSNRPAYDDFQDAFVLEPTCAGLRLVRASRHAGDVRSEERNSRWLMTYFEMGSDQKSGRGFGTIFDSSDKGLRFDAENAADAAKKVCFIVKGRGGRLE